MVKIQHPDDEIEIKPFNWKPIRPAFWKPWFTHGIRYKMWSKSEIKTLQDYYFNGEHQEAEGLKPGM